MMADHVCAYSFGIQKCGHYPCSDSVLISHNSPADPAVANNEFRRDTIWKYSVDKFMVLEMILSHASCLLVTLSIWPNICEKRYYNSISGSTYFVNICT